MNIHPPDDENRTDGPLRPIHELIGVYHADGTFGAEVAYWFGARLGRAHCSLCDITHGTFREKRAWRECRSALAIPFTTVHLDEQRAAVAALTAGSTPCVVADTEAGLVMLLTTADLESCAGSPAAFIETIATAAARFGLTIDE
jgi:hypothetical protein